MRSTDWPFSYQCMIIVSLLLYNGHFENLSRWLSLRKLRVRNYDYARQGDHQISNYLSQHSTR